MNAEKYGVLGPWGWKAKSTRSNPVGTAWSIGSL